VDTFQTEEEHVRRLQHEWTVQSVLFAFDALEFLGNYTPMSDGDEFWIADESGEPPEEERAQDLIKTFAAIEALAPAGIGALERRGTPGPEGVDASGAVMEAYDRWTKRQEG
jgi:hypothetical protein